MAVTLERILDLDANSFQFRHGSGGAGKQRPPVFNDLVQFIRAHFAGIYEADVSPWSVEPYRQVGRIRHVTGRVRHGFKLEVWPAGQPRRRYPAFSHVTCETYSTNWDLVRWITGAHRAAVQPTGAAATDGADPQPEVSHVP